MPTSSPVDVKGSVNYGALKDRNVIVTGGASGLGKSFVHMFAENGANVVVADVQDGPGKDLEKGLSSSAGKYVDNPIMWCMIWLLRTLLESSSFI